MTKKAQFVIIYQLTIKAYETIRVFIQALLSSVTEFVFLRNIFGKGSDLPFSLESDRDKGEKLGFVYA